MVPIGPDVGVAPPVGAWLDCTALAAAAAAALAELTAVPCGSGRGTVLVGVATVADGGVGGIRAVAGVGVALADVTPRHAMVVFTGGRFFDAPGSVLT